MIKKKLSPSIEDYLESIYKLKQDSKKVRVKDIAQELNISPSSVTEVLYKLININLIKHKKYGKVDLTKEGEVIAKNIFKRHKVIEEFLTTILGIDEKKAQIDSCKIEHSVSDETVLRLVKFIEFLKKSKNEDINFMEDFKNFLIN